MKVLGDKKNGKARKISCSILDVGLLHFLQRTGKAKHI